MRVVGISYSKDSFDVYTERGQLFEKIPFNMAKRSLETDAPLDSADAKLLRTNQLTEAADLILHQKANVEAKTKEQCSKIMLSAGRGNLEMVRELVARGANINHKDKYGLNALFYGVLSGSVETVGCLTEQGAFFLEKIKPVLAATCSGSVDILKLLLERGYSLEEKDSRQSTSLFLAAIYGHVEIIKFLLSQKKELLEVGNANGFTPFLGAVFYNQQEIILELIKHDVDVKAKTKTERNALMLASYNGHCDLIRLLVEHLGLEERDGRGKTAFMIAVQRNQWQAASVLLELGANIEAKDLRSMTSLCSACRSGNVEAAKFLLEHGAHHHRGDRDFLPLTFAIHYEKLEVARLLLESGADIEEKNSSGKAVLTIACQSLSVEVVGFLLQSGAKIEQQDNEGATPLMAAADSGRVNIIDILLEHGACLEVRDGRGRTPFIRAVTSGNLELARTLIRKGADLTATPYDGKTLLLCAATSPCPDKEMMEQILEWFPGTIDAQIGSGLTALHYLSREDRNKELIRFLLEKGANPLLRTKDSDWSVLQMAAFCSAHGLLQFYASQGLNIQERTKSGETLLHIASRNYTCCQRTLKTLLDLGLDVNAQDGGGKTPLHAACIYLKEHKTEYVLQGVRFLLENGADKTIKDLGGKTALDILKKHKKYPEIIKLLNGDDKMIKDYPKNAFLDIFEK